MQRSEQINELAAALAKAQRAIDIARKDSVNPHFKSKYADLANVWEAVREPLTANGLSIVQFPRTIQNGVEIETVLLHVSGQFMSDVLWMPVFKMDAPNIGSSITYGRRYALMAVAGIAPAATPDEIKDDVGDDDGVAATKPEDRPHKPGVPGSASGGTDLRPAGPRRMQPGQSSANGRRMANDDEHLLADRDKGTNGKPPAPDERARKVKEAIEKAPTWVDTAIGTLRLTGQTPDTLSQFLVDHHKQIRFLEDHAPEQHEKFFDAFNAASEAAQARVS